MKLSKVILGLGLVASLPAMAEPYGEWGVIGNNTSIGDHHDGDIPEASEVPIPLAPGGVVVVVNSYERKCEVVVRTRESIEDTCAFYRDALNPDEYQRRTIPFREGSPHCAFYEDGDVGGFGVMVHKNTDPMYERSGFTLVTVSYEPGRCGE